MKLRQALAFPWLLPLTVSLLVFALYLSVMPVRLTTANYGTDGGDFLAAILTGGIPHPTGYPTYILLGILFQKLPFGDPYTRAVLLSMIPAAVSAGLITLLVGWHIARKSQEPNWLAGGLVGTLLGVSPLVWSQAVIVEVHGLQTFMVVSAISWIFLLIRGMNWRFEKVLLMLLALFFGLGLGNHITLILLGPAVVFAFYMPYKRGCSIRFLIGLVVFVLLGLCVYLYLPIRASAYPPINWGNPQTFQGFLWTVTGQPYQRLLFETAPTNVLDRFIALAAILRDQFGVLGIILGIIGLVQYPFAHKMDRWVLLWILAIYPAFAIGYNTDDSVAYLLPACIAFAILIGLGVVALGDIRIKQFSIGPVMALLVLVIALVNLPAVRAKVDPRAGTQAAEFAKQVLAKIPQNTILLTKTDLDSFPIWYYHFGLGQRKDIAVIVLPLTQFAWYQETLVHTYASLKFPPLMNGPATGETWGKQIPGANPDRTVCRTGFQKNQLSMECANGEKLKFDLHE